MADLDYYGFGPDDSDEGGYRPPSGHVGRAINLLGAAMSLALVAGLAIWGYQLLVRDVTGIPVVRALEGPMRVQPDDPGGNRAAHQGLAVNRIAAVGEAAPPPDEIVLAPRSADLEAEDVAQGLLVSQPAIEPPPPREPQANPVERAILDATSGVMVTEATLSGDELIEVIPASVPGVSRSLRPRLRPEGLVRASVSAPSGPPAAEAAEVDAATLPPGTRLVYFDTYDTPAEAREAWSALTSQFGALLQDRDRVIERVDAGGRTLFRLHAAGFGDQGDARRLCAAVIAEQGDCIPVLSR